MTQALERAVALHRSGDVAAARAAAIRGLEERGEQVDLGGQPVGRDRGDL